MRVKNNYKNIKDIEFFENQIFVNDREFKINILPSFDIDNMKFCKVTMDLSIEYEVLRFYEPGDKYESLANEKTFIYLHEALEEINNILGGNDNNE